MDDATTVIVLSNVFKHRHSLWERGAEPAPELHEHVASAARIIGVPLTRDEVDKVCADIEEHFAENYTYTDLAWYMLNRIRMIGDPLG